MSSYDTFLQHWDDRLSQVAGAQQDVQKVVPILHADFQKLQRGEQTLTDNEANAGILTALTGQPVVTPPKRKTGPLDIIGNIPQDIAGIVQGLPKLPKAIYDTLTGPPEGYLNFIPGGFIAQNATTPEGRENLAQHPVMTFLDVLPYAKGAGELAAKSAAASGVIDAAEVARKEVVGAKANMVGKQKLIEPADQLTKAEKTYTAAAAGKPVRSLLEASGLREPLTRLVKYQDVPITQWISDSVALSKGHGLEGRKAQLVVHAFNKQLAPYFSKMDDADRELLYKEWTDQMPADHTPTPEHQAVMTIGRDLQDFFGKEGVSAGELFPAEYMGQTYYYSRHGEANQKLFAAQNRMMKLQDKLAAAKANPLSPPSLSSSRLGLDLTIPDPSDLAAIKTASHNATLELGDINNRIALGSSPFSKTLLTDTDRKALLADRKALRSYQKTINEIPKLTKQAKDARLTYNTRLQATAPAAFHPILEADIVNQAQNMVRGEYTAGNIGQEQLDQALAAIGERDIKRVFDPIMGNGSYEKLVNGIQSGWQELAQNGYDPIFLHNVPNWQPWRVDKARVMTLGEYRPGQFLPKDLMDMSPRYTNVGVGLSAAATEYVTRASTERFINDYLLPRGQSYDEALQSVRPQIDRYKAEGMADDTARGRALQEAYQLVRDPKDFGFESTKVTASMGTNGDGLYFPKNIVSAAKSLVESRQPSNIFAKIGQRGTAIWKASLFGLSVKHLADEALGNFLAIELGGGAGELKALAGKSRIPTPDFPSVWKVMADRDNLMNPVLSRGLDLASSDQIWSVAGGKTLGRMGKAVPNFLRHANEWVNDLNRNLAYYGEMDRALKSGKSAELAMNQGLQYANKMMIDWDSYIPLERTLLKQVFPFYSFTRWMMQYLYRYPADHPLRASIISHLANAEYEDQRSGLPQRFAQLFFLGPADKAGNVKAADVRLINPFRDAGNMFTWAGFLSGLGPFAEIPLTAAGVNTIGGTPELYPDVSIDPQTGQLVAKRTNIGSRSGVMQIIESFVPPTGGLDHFIGLTDRVRRLKATDPSAYRKQLFNSLGLNFIPYNVNVPVEVTKNQKNLLRVAEARVSGATRQDGSTRELRRFENVPWQGEIVPASALSDLIDQLHDESKRTGVPVRMLMAEVAKAVK